MWMNATAWAEIAPGLTPLVATAAVLLAWQQLALNRANQRETTAKATFREFLKLCVQYPDFAYGKPSSGSQEAYEWFVAYFLWAAEETLEYSRGDLEWHENLRLHMRYHRDYLVTDRRFRDEDLPTYSPSVQKLVREMAATTPSAT